MTLTVLWQYKCTIDSCQGFQYKKKLTSMSQIFRITMKTVLSLVLALSVSAGPALAWSDGNCPFSKKDSNQEASTEKVENSESSN